MQVRRTGGRIGVMHVRRRIARGCVCWLADRPDLCLSSSSAELWACPVAANWGRPTPSRRRPKDSGGRWRVAAEYAYEREQMNSGGLSMFQYRSSGSGQLATRRTSRCQTRRSLACSQATALVLQSEQLSAPLGIPASRMPSHSSTGRVRIHIIERSTGCSRLQILSRRWFVA